MKRFFVAALVSVLCVSLASCNGAGNTVPDTQKSGNGESNSAFSADETGASTSSTSTTPDIVVVPNVVGMDKDEAVKKLEGLGLEVETVDIHCRFKDGTGFIIDYLPNKQVISQSYQEGLAVGAKTKLTLEYTTHSTGFTYENLKDGTIAITKFSEPYVENGFLKIPTEYEGKRVSKIQSDFFQEMGTYWNKYGYSIGYLVPADVQVIGSITSTQIEYY